MLTFKSRDNKFINVTDFNMKKLFIVIFSLVFLLSNAIANNNNIDEFTKWLLENGHSQYVKEGDICKEYKKYSEKWFDSRCEEFPKGKTGIINNLNVNFFNHQKYLGTQIQIKIRYFIIYLDI